MSARWLPFLLLVVAVGCGESKIPVSGTVTYQDKPLGNVNVMMMREDGVIASGTVDSSDSFASVQTDGPGTGAFPGTYKVGITQQTKAPPLDAAAMGADTYAPAATPPIYPVQYLSPESSGLTVTVEAGMAPVVLTLTEKQ